MKLTIISTFLLLALLRLSVYAVTISTVPIGNAGNPADPSTGFGSVGYDYRIGATEVTNEQYAEFLNAVAASDPYALYSPQMGSDTRGGIIRTGSRGAYTYAVKPDAVGQGPGGSDYTYVDKPVVLVSWYDAIRFANWLHNGQGNGGTESGAYMIGPSDANGDPINGLSITRNPDAIWWLPSEDEWYKAAYYDAFFGIYREYPTGTNSLPNNNLPSADTGNSANVWASNVYTTGNSSYPMTDVGAYLLSSSPYGTFDQGGNAREWNEALIANCCGEFAFRGVRGGDWTGDYFWMSRSARGDNTPHNNPNGEGTTSGFRIASLPDPTVLIGDYNEDGTVDAADYAVWRRWVGYVVTPCSLGDANCNGFVEVVEYQPWRENFGRSLEIGGNAFGSVAGGPAENVPEPLSLALIALAVVRLLGRGFQRDRIGRGYFCRNCRVGG